MNSNGMDVYLGDGHLTYHVTGGVLDFYILMVRAQRATLRLVLVACPLTPADLSS